VPYEDYYLSSQLAAALAVAETASFSQAARRLQVQQSTISRRIRNLEDSLGVSLFERYTHGVRLTESGRTFLEQVTLSRSR
jgi:DNA-binding transcriptional LysR family regulator